MAKIEPFASIHYDPESVGDISKVVCPPYDVIDPGMQEALYQKHPYNFIRLILGKEKAQDNDTANKYTRAADHFKEWLRRGILVQDDALAMYFYEQDFKAQGKPKKRFGVIGLMGLDGQGSSKAAYPHEHTHSAPKEDRLRVFKAVEANLSPIFTIYSDPKKVIRTVFKKAIKGREPFLVAVDSDGGTNKIWRVTDKALIGKVRAFLSAKDLFIADGHHRFEVAKMFRDHKKASDPEHFKDSYNYIMTYFTALEDEGLVVLPTHRLIKNAHFSIDALKTVFSVKEVADKDALASQMKKNSDRPGSFGLYKDGKIYFFKVVSKKATDRLIQDGPRAYKDLDVAILHRVAFDRLLNIRLPQISYEVDLAKAMKAVDDKRFEALFVLNPTRVSQIRDIALGGEVMPQKSTYFYPKLLSGLVINKF